MTLDQIFHVVLYIIIWENFFGDMEFLMEISTKVNAKIVWRNNVWKDQPCTIATIGRIIYRYIKFILIATGNFKVVHHGSLLGHLLKEYFGTLNKENGHQHIVKGGVSQPLLISLNLA